MTAREQLARSAGDALLQNPPTIHASTPAARPRHRRVLHLVYAPADFPRF